MPTSTSGEGFRFTVLLLEVLRIKTNMPHFSLTLRTVLTCPVLQGYGLTETCSTACISDPDDLSVGHVGPPLPGVDLKIVGALFCDEET